MKKLEQRKGIVRRFVFKWNTKITHDKVEIKKLD